MIYYFDVMQPKLRRQNNSSVTRAASRFGAWFWVWDDKINFEILWNDQICYFFQKWFFKILIIFRATQMHFENVFLNFEHIFYLEEIIRKREY